MFNTDSLAWQWHIPELARQIYPWVSWLYREYYQSGRFFFWLSACFSVWLNSGPAECVLVGLSHKARRGVCRSL